VAQLDLGMRAQPDDADQPLRQDRAKNPRLRDQFLETLQRPVSLVLECRGERFRMAVQTLEADVPESQGIGATE
jgi:hypothetical protein